MALYPSIQIQICPAILQDAKRMSRVLADIFALWKSNRAYDLGLVVLQYINASDKIACSVAVTGQATVLGFQSLKLAGPNNPYGVTPGWGFIGTYVARDVAKNGIGRERFGATLIAAGRARIATVDATIGAANRSGLGYYHAVGFTTYSWQVNTVSKRCSVALTPLPVTIPNGQIRPKVVFANPLHTEN